MLTLPNILTLSRIFAIPLLAYFLWWPGWAAGYLLAFGLYCLMGITDYFDGYLARTSGTVSKLGIFLDPIADKIMVAAVILVLAAQGVLLAPGDCFGHPGHMRIGFAQQADGFDIALARIAAALDRL